MRRFSFTTGVCATFVGILVTLVTVASCIRASSLLMVTRSTGARAEAGVRNEIDTVTLMPGDAKVANLRLELSGADMTSAVTRRTLILCGGTS